jgi:hypothetical protein
MNPKQFMDRWIDGMKNLSPRRQLEVSIAFSWGNLFGFFGGFLTMLVWMIGTKDYKFWWTVLVLFLAFGATWNSMIGMYQQKRAIDQVEEQLKNLTGLTV